MTAPRRSPGTWIALVLYWPLRPILRPLAWRLRTFLLSPVREELEGVRGQQRDILAALAELRNAAQHRPGLDPAVVEAALLTLGLSQRRD